MRALTFYTENAIINSDMWELKQLTPQKRGISIRSILMYACAAFIAALIFIVAAPQQTFAADASWNGDSIVYNNNTYVGPASSATISNLKLADNTKAYTYVDLTNASSQRMHVIYFAPGSDPGSLDKANYRTYTYVNSTTFTDPSAPAVISLDQSTANASATSCDVEGGLGWIICPLTNTLAKGMDIVYDILSGFLTVQPAEANTDSALYRAWALMRSIANIAFVIAFLIIIYSQLTNYGISNYGIKKLLPRVIVAALLVNLSYLICSLAIDISNVLGYGIQDLFIQIRNSLTTNNTGGGDILTWSSVSSFILSGGAMAASGLIIAGGNIATYGVVGALALLLPALATMFVAVLIALVVMAARQAIVTILVILAPLAFVAYLLPNTEKWFDRWRGTFMTMLILFPAFSVIFGGSQLAGTVIIQNANSINLIILGMVVQVAPLFITPFLIKFSGSLLGRIAGMVNDPNKGIIDRTKNWSKDRAEDMRAKRMATPAGINPAKRIGQAMDRKQRRREGYRSAYNSLADANWANHKTYGDISMLSSHAGDIKQLGESNAGIRYAEAKIRNEPIRDTSRRLALNAMRNEAAKRTFNDEFTKELEANQTITLPREGITKKRVSVSMQEYAGGIQGETGAARALARAYSDQSGAHAENIKIADTILAHKNFTDDVIKEIALGINTNAKITITPDIQEAALSKVAGGKGAKNIMALSEDMVIDNGDMTKVLADALMENGARPKWLTGGVLANIKQGKPITDASGNVLNGAERTAKLIVDAFNANKFNSAETLTTMDSAYLERMLDVMKSHKAELNTDALAAFSDQLNRAFTTASYAGRMGDNRGVLQTIQGLVPAPRLSKVDEARSVHPENRSHGMYPAKNRSHTIQPLPENRPIQTRDTK